MPAWGGNETLLRARAIENHAYVISSGYDIKSLVVAPDGKVASMGKLHESLRPERGEQD